LSNLKNQKLQRKLYVAIQNMIGHRAVTIAACSEEKFQEAKESQNRIAEAEPEVKEKSSPDVKEKLQD
jgi:hypothetical protein